MSLPSSDLSGQARLLEEGPLLVPPPPARVQPQQKPRRKNKQGGSDSKMAWAKGFLSAGSAGSTRSQASPKARGVAMPRTELIQRTVVVATDGSSCVHRAGLTSWSYLSW